MNLYDALNELNIEYDEVSHEPVFTVLDAMGVSDICGIGCKCLFLRSKKGNYYLVLLDERKRVDMAFIADLLNESRLSFALVSDLWSVLGVECGSVSPFGIINDCDNLVTLVIDGDLKGKRLLVHPNVNTRTISIDYDDLIRFIEYCNHCYKVI